MPGSVVSQEKDTRMWPGWGNTYCALIKQAPWQVLRGDQKMIATTDDGDGNGTRCHLKA